MKKTGIDREIDQQTAGIVFRDPPAIKRPRKSQTDEEVADFLRKIAWRKGDWAVFRTGMNKATAYTKASRYRKQFPHSEWVARPGRGSTYTLYARVLYI